MTNNYYSINASLEGYKDSADTQLSKELETLGFRFKLFEGGGGEGQEIIQQIVAYLSVHEFWVGFFSSLAASRVEKILSKLFEWDQKNKIKDNEKIPKLVIIDIYIKPYFGRNKSYSLDFEIDKRITKKEIKERIKKTNKVS